MHSVKLEIEDSVLDKVIYFLQNFPSDEEKSDTEAFSNHSANLIDEWKEPLEDEMFRIKLNYLA